MAINKLVLPSSVNTIKDYAFKNPSNLSKVIVGGGVNTELSAVLTALSNKISLGKNIFNGISKIHTTHSFSYTITKAVTCTSAGTKTGNCKCGNTDTQSIAATGHSYGSWVISSDETTKSRTCSKCGNKETVNITKVELKDADTATKNKYNFKGIMHSATIVSYFYGNGNGDRYGSWSSVDAYNTISTITPDTLEAGSIIFIPELNIDQSKCHGHTYAIDGSSTKISSGYYKIKAICKRSSTLFNSTNYSGGAISLIPFAMGSYYSSTTNSSSGGSSTSTSYSKVDAVKRELSKYIEYLGTSYIVTCA